jgi:hypothetical protein
MTTILVHLPVILTMPLLVLTRASARVPRRSDRGVLCATPNRSNQSLVLRTAACWDYVMKMC